MRGTQRYLTSRAPPPARPPCDGSGAAGVGGVVDQKIRDTEYAKAMEYQGQAPLDLTEPRLEAELTSADNAMAAETRSTGYITIDTTTRPRGNVKGSGCSPSSPAAPPPPPP
jgi:hypothetical protein